MRNSSLLLGRHFWMDRAIALEIQMNILTKI